MDQLLQLLIVDFLTVFFIIVAHHEKVTFQLLLLCRIQLTLFQLVSTAALVFFIITVVVLRILRLCLLRMEVLLHMTELFKLPPVGFALVVELSGVKLNA